MYNKVIPIDFEFNGTKEARLNLVCCSMQVDGKLEEYWLHDGEYYELRNRILELREQGYIFLAFNVIAEAQSFISLGINPTKCQWLDLQQDWKMLTNHCHKFMYGDQIIKGRKVTTRAPKYGDDKTVSNAKPDKNLVACIYKLLGIDLNLAIKNEIRDLIISANVDKIEANKKLIMDYCTSDIKYLVPAYDKVIQFLGDYFERKPEKSTLEHALLRGETASRCALMQATGYPVDVEKMRNFSNNVPNILKDLCEDINSQFDAKFFKWNKKEEKFSMFLKPIKDWIENSEYKNKWLMTAPSKTKPNGDYSLSLDAWEKHFSYRHEYPRNHLPAQVLRYLKTRRSLNGFLPKSSTALSRETIFDSLGSDGRVRSYLNPYGSQSSRFQPKATSFLFLKSAWVRSLCSPKKGSAIVGIDYKSEEFLLAGLIANDKNMIEAYKSGDVYLYFAKLAGAVPWDGTKKEYEKTRDLFKATTLGISYSMGAEALARKLSDDTGEKYTKKDAQELISKFSKAYPDYTRWIDIARYTYRERKYWQLPDGWTMFGGNDNERSISNMPVQGLGGCILRKAIALAQDAGLKVILPLHDAVYVEFPSNDFSKIDLLAKCMREAFGYFFEGETKKLAEELVGLDFNIWGPDFEDGEFKTPAGYEGKKQTIYIDGRALDEYERFKKYF